MRFELVCYKSRLIAHGFAVETSKFVIKCHNAGYKVEWVDQKTKHFDVRAGRNSSYKKSN